MDFANRLAISYYDTITTIDEAHKIYLVKHRETGKICIKKLLTVYNLGVYEYLMQNPVAGTPDIICFYEEDGVLTLIEEYIPGVTLKECMEKSPLSRETILHIMIQLCEILEKLHRSTPPIIHRDLKPSNIILTKFDRVVLLDFNAAKHFSQNTTEDTILLGTKGYAAPEQYGFGSSTPQTDIYALGIILKELSKATPETDAYFERIVNHATMLNPSDRYQSVRELKEDLLQLDGMSTDTDKKPSCAWYFLPGFRTRKPWKMAIAIIAYAFILWLSLTLKVKDLSMPALWFERIMCLLILLSVVFTCFNYQNMQEGFPLCKNKNPLMHYLGVLILNVIIVFSLFVIMAIVESVFFSVP